MNRARCAFEDGVLNETTRVLRVPSGKRLPHMTATLTNPLIKLSPREQQVAVLLAYGHTNAEVAEHLSISTRTVEMHRAHAMQKLGAESRADISRWALDNHLLQ